MNGESKFGLTSSETSSKAECQAQGTGQTFIGCEKGSTLILNNCQRTMKTKDLWHPAWVDLNTLVTARDPAGAAQTLLGVSSLRTR